MNLQPNHLYEPLFTGKHRYVICMGGRASGRSFTASQYALLQLISSNYARVAIMRFVLGDVRNSIFQEIRDRIEENELENHVKIKENSLTFEFGNNKINGIGFRKSSGDQKSKLKSLANYNVVIIEEADEVAEEDFIQLDDSLRTLKSDIKIILLLNPPDKNHWIIRRWFNLISSGVEGFYKAELKKEITDVCHITGTYLGNKKNLNQSTINNFEKYKETNPDHYWNMIRGYVSEGMRGRIYKNWQPITNKEYEELPHNKTYWLDFGFSNDPTAFGELKEHNDKIWIKELLYKTGLTNQDISREFERLGVDKNDIIYADSAEPKSIEELNREGWNVLPAEKGQDSIRAGIDYLLGKQVYYTEDSTNLALEIQNYTWQLDKNKEPTNKPIDDHNHCFASNSLVYTLEGKKRIKDLVGKSGYLYSRGGQVCYFTDVRETRKNADVVTLSFDDGNNLTVTPDHLLLNPNGEWVKAGSLNIQDIIQSGMYEYKNTRVSREHIQNVSWGKVLQSWTEKITQGCLGILQWGDTKKLSHSPQGRESSQQLDKEFRVETQVGTPKRTHNTRTQREGKDVGGDNKTSNKEMARFGSWKEMALGAREGYIQKKEAGIKELCPLSRGVSDFTTSNNSEILPSELQNESKTKKITRVTRGRRAIVYNMEVKGTECLWVDGIIAHNCLDGIRYGVFHEKTFTGFA